MLGQQVNSKYSEKRSTKALIVEQDSQFGIMSTIKPILGTVNGSEDVIVVGIAGGSGSGKTTLARAIYQEIGDENVVYISHDSYYRDISHLSLEERAECNFDHPDSLETSL